MKLRRSRPRPPSLSDELLDPSFLGRLERLHFRFRRLRTGEGVGDLATPREGLGTLFREHRAYAPGDDPRRLDWNAYLRLGDLLTITTESEEAPRITILLDQSASMGLWDGAKRRHATLTAAGLGALALLHGASLHLFTYPSSDTPTQFRGRSSIPTLLRHLATPLRPITNSLPTLADSAASRRTSGPAIFLSDFLETAHLTTTLRHLAAAGYALHLVRLHDPNDFDLPTNTPLNLTDIESNRSLRLRLTPSDLAAYQSTLSNHLSSLRSLSHRLSIPLLEVPTSTSPNSTLLSLLRATLTPSH